MATLPRRDSDDLASLVGEPAAAVPDDRREAVITGALRRLPSAVQPDAEFTQRLRATLMERAEEAREGCEPAEATPK